MTWTFSDIRELSAFLLRSSRIEKPEVDVEGLAYHLGVDAIITRRLDREEGRLELQGSKAVILLNADMSRARRRFTVAHEVGHLVLADPRFDLAPLRSRPAFRSDERFCDRLAEELLMPTVWIRERFLGMPQSLSSLLSFTTQFGVSAAAAAVRLQRVLNWSRSLLRFELRRREWTLLSVTAWQPEPRTSVHATKETRAVLEQFAVPDSISRLWLPLKVNGEEWHVAADLWGRSGWAMALADPTLRRPLRRREEVVVGTKAPAAPHLKLFYSLDDIDACIISCPSDSEGNRERSEDSKGDRRLAAA